MHYFQPENIRMKHKKGQ